jgi:NADH-quinone oxidoreductase subunit L
MYLPLIVLAIFAVGVGWGANHVLVRLHDALIGSVIGALIIVGLVCWSRWRGSGSSESQADTSWAKVPLMICGGVFLVGLVWVFAADVSLSNMLAQARPLGTAPTEEAALLNMTWPDESLSHEPSIMVPATLIASGTALAGFLLATIFYGWRLLDAEEARRQFAVIHKFLLNKWWFDELYDFIFVRPTHFVCGLVSNFDRRCIDRLVDSLARGVRKLAIFWERLADQTIVDGSVNYFAKCAYGLGSSLRRLQTGSLRNYVLFIVVGMLALFVLASFLLSGAFAS